MFFALSFRVPPEWLNGEHVGLMTWLLSSTPVEATFLPGYIRISPLQKHVRKVVGGFGKKSYVSKGVREPGNTCASVKYPVYLVKVHAIRI